MGTICVSKPDGSWAQCVPLAKAPPTISCSSDCTKSPSTSQMYCMILHVIICNSNTRLVTSTTHAHSNMHHYLIHIDSMCQRERERLKGIEVAGWQLRIVGFWLWILFGTCSLLTWRPSCPGGVPGTVRGMGGWFPLGRDQSHPFQLSKY